MIYQSQNMSRTYGHTSIMNINLNQCCCENRRITQYNQLVSYHKANSLREFGRQCPSSGSSSSGHSQGHVNDYYLWPIGYLSLIYGEHLRKYGTQPVFASCFGTYIRSSFFANGINLEVLGSCFFLYLFRAKYCYI